MRTFALKAQSGILPENDTNGYFGQFNINYDIFKTDSKRKTLISGLKQFQDELKACSDEHKVDVTGCIGFGTSFWNHLTNSDCPYSIDFPGYTDRCPSTQYDFFIHIHSKKQDATFDASCKIINKFISSEALLLKDETYGFVFKDARDLTMFIDGTKNPKGDEKRIDASLDSDGNSYALVQKYIHNINKWTKETVESQEKVIGRTKIDSVELKPLPPTSHVGSVDLKDEHGKGMKIVRHSLPFGTASGDKGLVFVAYCNSISPLDAMLKSMFGLRGSHHDKLMEYTKPITGSYFFIPNLDLIQHLE